jgi:flagellar protein FliO/FliZ
MDWQNYARGLLALVFVLALILAATWAVRRFGLAGMALTPRRQRRMSIAEVLAIDNRRRLVLVRRDDTEHLLLIGGTGGDVVVESGILAKAARAIDNGSAS